MNMMKTILLVDDDINLLESVAELLRTRGYFVLDNSDLGEALQSWSPKEDLSVALAEMDIPGIDDISLLTEVRRIHPTIEELLTTGELRWWGPAASDDADDVQDCLSYDELF